jgi:hypothetical protein
MRAGDRQKSHRTRSRLLTLRRRRARGGHLPGFRRFPACGFSRCPGQAYPPCRRPVRKSRSGGRGYRCARPSGKVPVAPGMHHGHVCGQTFRGQRIRAFRGRAPTLHTLLLSPSGNHFRATV